MTRLLFLENFCIARDHVIQEHNISFHTVKFDVTRVFTIFERKCKDLLTDNSPSDYFNLQLMPCLATLISCPEQYLSTLFYFYF